MKITFIWDGHDLADAQKKEIQSNISNELDTSFADSLYPPVSVYLFHDLLKSIILGYVSNSEGKKVIKITIQINNSNKTSYELV